MKLLYICSKNTYDAMAHWASESHWIELPNREILISAEFRNDHLESQFSEHPGIQALPHPFSGEAIGPEIAAKLGHLEIHEKDGQKTKIAEHHNHHHVSKAAGRIHPLMKGRT